MDPKKKKEIPIYRIAVMGMMGVGKTSIVTQFVNNNFESQYEETCKDIRQYRKLIDVSKGDTSAHQYVILVIDDIFGLNHPSVEDYGNLDKTNKDKLISIMENKYLKNNQLVPKIYLEKQIYGYIFVYDVMERNTLEYLKKYIEHIDENEEKKKSGIDTKKVLVGNKIDLINEKEKEKFMNSKTKDINELSDKYHMTHHYCSAAENYNVDQIFEDLVRSIMTDIKIEVIENDFAEATQDLHPKKPKPDKSTKKRRKDQQQTWGDNFLSTLGCGNRIEEDSDESDDKASNNGDENERASIPKFEKAEEKTCEIF